MLYRSSIGGRPDTSYWPCVQRVSDALSTPYYVLVTAHTNCSFCNSHHASSIIIRSKRRSARRISHCWSRLRIRSNMDHHETVGLLWRQGEPEPWHQQSAGLGHCASHRSSVAWWTEVNRKRCRGEGLYKMVSGGDSGRHRRDIGGGEEGTKPERETGRRKRLGTAAREPCAPGRKERSGHGGTGRRGDREMSAPVRVFFRCFAWIFSRLRRRRAPEWVRGWCPVASRFLPLTRARARFFSSSSSSLLSPFPSILDSVIASPLDTSPSPTLLSSFDLPSLRTSQLSRWPRVMSTSPTRASSVFR